MMSTTNTRMRQALRMRIRTGMLSYLTYILIFRMLTTSTVISSSPNSRTEKALATAVASHTHRARVSSGMNW